MNTNPLFLKENTSTLIIFNIKFTKLGYFLNLYEFYGTKILLQNYGTQLLFLAFDEINLLFYFIAQVT